MTILSREDFDEPDTELTEPDTKLIKTMSLPVQSNGEYLFALVVNCKGRSQISVETPDGVESSVKYFSSTSTNYESLLVGQISVGYVGADVIWSFIFERYSVTQDTPRPTVNFKSIMLMDNTYNNEGDVNNVHTMVVLSPHWGTFKHDEVMFEIPSGGGGGVDPVPPDPTSTNIVSGNVKKLNLPFEAHVVAVSLGLEPEVVGSTISDAVTGDYSIDVYPHEDEVLLYVTPEYGDGFTPKFNVSEGQVIHPTVPNKHVYVTQNAGELGDTEPEWSTAGLISSGEVDLLAVPLYRPLANGFIKPIITPI